MIQAVIDQQRDYINLLETMLDQAHREKMVMQEIVKSALEAVKARALEGVK